jgi:deoxynucleoside triphosphate triphosphohydrolase SAMHD1
VSAETSPIAIKEVAEALALKFLEPYFAVAQDRQFSRKEVNDSLWGTIVLTPIEVAVLDSPLLQRLRSMRQLGVVHWVYPGAVHTRFEHALGMLFQMQQLISALNTAWDLQHRENEPVTALIDGKSSQLLRLCALLRDVGQMAFSQASESALENLPEFLTLSSDFTTELLYDGHGEDRQLSEIFAYYVVRSPAMERLFYVLLRRLAPEVCFNRDDEVENVREVLEKIARTFIGRKIDDQRPLLHELVSGPYSAERLDQLVRDARFAGTPSLLDIPRLLQKLSVRRMPANQLPQDIAGQVALGPDDFAWLFGVKRSGASVLDELQLAQVLAYTKIYRHPKVVAIEQMVRSFIEAVSGLVSPDRLLMFLYSEADDAIITFSRAALAEALGLDISRINDEANERLARAGATLRAIRERSLWVQAFQYPGSYLARGDADLRARNLDRFLERLTHPQRREEFAGELRGEVRRVTQLLAAEPASTSATNDSMVMINVPGQIAGETQTGRAFLIQKSGEPVPLSQNMAARGNWAEQYMSEQPRAYIFSPAQLADIVYVAVEKLARVELNAKFPELFIEASKREAKSVRALKRALDAKGYWEGLPYDLRPKPERMEKADTFQTITYFDRLRQSFQEPEADAARDPVSSQIPKDRRTGAWLRQFTTSDHIDCALTILRDFRLLTRADTVSALRDFIVDSPEFQGAWVIPFGSMKDSSVTDAYFAPDIQPAIEGVHTLDEYASSGGGRPLIFIDNFIASGNQATDVLAAWFGRNDLRKTELNEKRDTLPSQTVELLRRTKIGFVFVAGWDDGITAVRNISNELGINAQVYCYLNEGVLPFARDRLLKAGHGEAKVERFLTRCREIGLELVNSEPRTEPLKAEIALQRALGYGNRGMLMATMVNVPTQSLTAVWMSGKVGGADWTPLMRRRKKN